MHDNREKIFHAALERVDLSRVPALGGWTRKIAEMEEHRANFGRVNETGCFMVQSGRKTDDRVEQAIDLLSCLPNNRRAVGLIFARYCNPYMLEDYPGIITVIRRVGLYPAHDGWNGWTKQLSREGSVHVGKFWEVVAARRVLRKRG